MRRVCVGLVECVEYVEHGMCDACDACGAVWSVCGEVLRGRHLINWLRSESVEEIEYLHQLFFDRSFYSCLTIGTCVVLEARILC